METWKPCADAVTGKRVLCTPSSDNRIRAGDNVILYETHAKIFMVTAGAEKPFGHRLGSLDLKKLMGLEYGARVYFPKGGWLGTLMPTPELWTHALSHRTQIIYAADISFITLQLELKPGSVVLESGTGSGSLSTALARSVAPSGRLYTYEFNEFRAEKAKEDFEKNQMGDVVTVTWRDVLKNGFKIDGEEILADAVFLDLPGPWDAIPHAADVIKENGKLCCFSPCVEQVQRNSEALAKNGFADIRTFETLLREYDSKDVKLVDPFTDEIISKRQQKREVTLGQKRKRDGKDGVDQEHEGNDKNEVEAGDGEETIKAQGTQRMQKAIRPFPEMRGHTAYLTFARRKGTAADPK